MQNSTNQPSTSDSPQNPLQAEAEALVEEPQSAVETDASTTNGRKPLPADDNPNVRLQIDVEDLDVDDVDEAMPDVVEMPEHEVEPEPDVMSSSIVRADGIEVQKPPPPPSKARPKADAEAPPSPKDRVPGRRSIRMQLRYTRSLIWASGLLIRILFWEWIVKRVMGEEFVRARNVARWKQYARDLRVFAADMGGVFIKAGQFISTRADIFPEEIIL